MLVCSIFLSINFGYNYTQATTKRENQPQNFEQLNLNTNTKKISTY